MARAEAQSRKGRKQDAGVDKLVNAARLEVLSKFLGEDIKRTQEVGSNSFGTDPNKARNDEPTRESGKDEVIKLGW